MKLYAYITLGCSTISGSAAEEKDEGGFLNFLRNGASAWPGQWTLGIYANLKAEAASNDLEKLFADGLKTMANYKKVPAELHKAVLDDLMDKPDTRALNCDGERCEIPLSLEPIWGYGCWCNFGSELSTGYSAPVDIYDSICRELQFCLRCAEMDAEDYGYSCDVTNQNNTYEAEWSFGVSGLEADCDGNEDPCMTSVCMCETGLIADLLALIFESERVKPEVYGHEEGFDRVENCPTIHPSPGDEKTLECCGDYPKRYTYNSNHFSCCDDDGGLFNPLNQCCSEGVGVQDAGDCS